MEEEVERWKERVIEVKENTRGTGKRRGKKRSSGRVGRRGGRGGKGDRGGKGKIPGGLSSSSKGRRFLSLSMLSTIGVFSKSCFASINHIEKMVTQYTAYTVHTRIIAHLIAVKKRIKKEKKEKRI